MKKGVLAIVAALALIGILWAVQGKGDGKQEVKFELPQAQYIGTPKTIPAGTTVQKPRVGPREALIAPSGTTNIALNKKVTASDNDPAVGSIDFVTDGQKEGTEGNWVELGTGVQWVQVDLGATATIYGLLVWHQHNDPTIYRDVIFQISDDKDMKTGVVTVFNNDQDNSAKLGAGKDFEYFESAEGLLVDCQKTDAKGLKGRYVRCYSNGSVADGQNRYTEVEVYGILPK